MTTKEEFFDELDESDGHPKIMPEPEKEEDYWYSGYSDEEDGYGEGHPVWF